MTICAVNGCSNRSSRRNPTTPSVSFYCLPKVISNQCDRTRELSEKRRKLWLEKINRRELYFKKDVRICSVHFISGKPAYLMHDSHPDWLPTLKLGRERSLVSSRPWRARRVRRGKHEEVADEKEVGEATDVASNSQVASERVSGRDKIASHKRTASNRQARGSKKVAGNVKAANSKVALSNRRVKSNKRAANVKRVTGNRKVADEEGVAEDEEVAVSKEVAAQGLLELAGMRTREETGLSAVQEWLELYDGNVDMEQETGVGTQTTLKMRDIVALEFECRNLRRQLHELRERKPTSSSG
uniref:THAP-type domain-containing protein n=1 Tax=Ixodes ricinus TaxID=34613 RepID=V5HKX5_IXORI